MRLPAIVGIVLIAGGTFLLWKRPTYSTRHDVVEIGEFRASVREQESYPIWIGPGLIGLGVIALLVASRRSRG